MYAVILLAHGSLRSDAGREVNTHAERLRRRGIGPVVEVAFLNYSRPPLAEVVSQCIARGATRITIAPYFLVPGKFVEEDVPRVVAEAAAAHPETEICVGAPIGYDPRLSLAVLECATADSVWSRQGAPPSRPQLATSLVLMAHGSPNPTANESLYRVVSDLHAQDRYATVEAGFLECNEPPIPQSIAACIEAGARRVVGIPYFLHSGRHVSEDIPALLNQAAVEHPGIAFVLGRHIGMSEQITEVLETRLTECEREPGR